MQETFRGTTGERSSKQLLKVRCPQCFQSYSVNAAEIHQPKPRFACEKCHTKFWLPFPEALKQEELIGFPISWLETKSPNTAPTINNPQKEAQRRVDTKEPTKQEASESSSESSHSKNSYSEHNRSENIHREACSHCGYENPVLSSECAKCGIIFENFKAQQEEASQGVRATKKLREQWQKVIADFYNDENHERFLLECQRLNNLAYASHRYRRLEEAMGPDDKILEMKERIVKASEQALYGLRKSPVIHRREKRSRPSWLRLSNVILILSVIIIAIGYVAPEGRNLIGVGAATAFLALALRIYFKNS